MNFTELLEHHLLDRTFFRFPAILGVSLPVSKHMVMMWVAAFLLIVLFVPVAAAVRRGRRGLAVNLLEAVVSFIRNDIVLPNLGERGRRYVPYFLSLFFFILFVLCFSL